MTKNEVLIFVLNTKFKNHCNNYNETFEQNIDQPNNWSTLILKFLKIYKNVSPTIPKRRGLFTKLYELLFLCKNKNLNNNNYNNAINIKQTMNKEQDNILIHFIVNKYSIDKTTSN